MGHPKDGLPVAKERWSRATAADEANGFDGTHSARVLALVNEPPDGILDAAPDGILSFDDTGVIVSANRKVELIFGYHREEIIGSPVHTLLPRWPTRPAPSPDNPGASPRGSNTNTRIAGRTSDGVDIPLEVHVSPLYTEHGLRTIVVLRATSSPLTHHEEVRATAVLESTDDAVWVVDATSHRLTYVNQGLLDQLGFRRHELLGADVGLIAPGFVGGALPSLAARLRTDEGASLVHHVLLQRSDGRYVSVEARSQALTGSRAREQTPGATGAYVCVARAVDGRAEEEAARRDADLHEERDRIGRDLHDGVMQRIFATAMALKALGVRRPDVGIESDLAHIVDELDRCIVDLRHVVDGITPEDLVEDDLRSDLLQVLEDEEIALALTPTIRFTGDLEAIDAAWRHHIAAIFREALSNIARHASASHVDIDVEVTDSFVLRLSDDGVGFDPAHVRRGRGLRNLSERARALGGSFTVSSHIGGGTVVQCDVPLARSGS